jgi:hypothetical protein
MLQDPEEEIFILSTPFDNAAKRLLGAPLFENKPLSASEYRRTQVLAEAVKVALAGWGWEPRDMIDVQSFIYVSDQMMKHPAAPTDDSGVRERPSGGEMVGGGFEGLLTSIREQGLYFPPDLVANYLLALQTKRFAILTGTSGTGKTQLALQVAQHFRPVVEESRAVDVPEDALDLQVHPYMLDHHQMVIPADFAAKVRLPLREAQAVGDEVNVEYPGGKTTLTVGKDPQRNVTWLSFRGAFRQWFESHLKAGDRVLMSVLANDGGTETLRFSLPVTERRYAPLDNYVVVAVRPDWTDGRGLLVEHHSDQVCTAG